MIFSMADLTLGSRKESLLGLDRNDNSRLESMYTFERFRIVTGSKVENLDQKPGVSLRDVARD